MRQGDCDRARAVAVCAWIRVYSIMYSIPHQLADRGAGSREGAAESGKIDEFRFSYCEFEVVSNFLDHRFR